MIDIVIPPFASLEFPSLDAAVATQVLREMGISVNVNYINQDFSELIGSSVYTSIANIPPTRGSQIGLGQVHFLDQNFLTILLAYEPLRHLQII